MKQSKRLPSTRPLPKDKLRLVDYRFGLWSQYNWDARASPGKTKCVAYDGELFGIVSDESGSCVAVRLDFCGRQQEIISVFPEPITKLFFWPNEKLACIYIFCGNRLMVTRDKFKSYIKVEKPLPFFDIRNACMKDKNVLICTSSGKFHLSQHEITHADFGTAWTFLMRSEPVFGLLSFGSGQDIVAVAVRNGRRDVFCLMNRQRTGLLRWAIEDKRKPGDRVYDLCVDTLFYRVVIVRDSGIYETRRVGHWRKICENPYAPLGLLPIPKSLGTLKLYFLKDGDILLGLETFNNSESFPIFLCQRQVRLDRHKLLVTEILNKLISEQAMRDKRTVQTLDVALIVSKIFPFLFPTFGPSQIARDTTIFA